MQRGQHSSPVGITARAAGGVLAAGLMASNNRPVFKPGQDSSLKNCLPRLFHKAPTILSRLYSVFPSMPPLPSQSDPCPPAVLRACAHLSRLDIAGGAALADELMASNPDFLCHALALAKVGVPMAKVDAALRVALFLELCHRGQQGRPLPLFAPQSVAAHRRKTLESLGRISDLSNVQPDHATKLFLATQPQIHVTAWIFEFLKNASVIPTLHDDDVKVVASAFTLISLYASAFPPVLHPVDYPGNDSP